MEHEPVFRACLTIIVVALAIMMTLGAGAMLGAMVHCLWELTGIVAGWLTRQGKATWAWLNEPRDYPPDNPVVFRSPDPCHCQSCPPRRAASPKRRVKKRPK